MRWFPVMCLVCVAVSLAHLPGVQAQSTSGTDGSWWEHGAAPSPERNGMSDAMLPDSVQRARSRLLVQLRRVQRSDADVIPRVVLEMLAGYGGGVLGVLFGAFLGSLACAPLGASYEPDAWSCHGGRGAVMGVLGSAVTAAAMGGVYEALGGLAPSLGAVGAVGGAAGYIALGQTLALTSPDPAIADDIGGGMLLALIPLVANVLALELADDGEADAVRRAASVLPSLTTLNDGRGQVVGALAAVGVELP